LLARLPLALGSTSARNEVGVSRGWQVG
jgi:hypothetical protein